MSESYSIKIGRRAMLQGGTLLLGGTAMTSQLCAAEEKKPALRVGLVTDMHYADKSPAGTRHYRQTLDKVQEAGTHFEKHQIDMLVELGDFIDAADTVATEQKYLKTINREFSSICKERHYVLGNHCVDTLTKNEFLGGVEQEKSYYSFDKGGIHFVILDACFRSDGVAYQRKNFKWTDANIPTAELEWLTADLKATALPVIVFAHQRMDVRNNHGVKNNAAVRKILEARGNVLAVFQGHSHKNDLKDVGGIHYCTLRAMVEGAGQENNGYSLMEVTPGGAIKIQGFRKQQPYQWVAAK